MSATLHQGVRVDSIIPDHLTSFIQSVFGLDYRNKNENTYLGLDALKKHVSSSDISCYAALFL